MGKYLIAFQLMVVGMGTVLITLFILSLFIRVNSKFFNKKDNTKNTKNSIENTIEKNKVTDKQEINQGISPAKVAAISASIYNCLGGNESNYKIISIRRNKSNWKR